MKLSQIKYVLEISKHLNFTSASKKLHISQPALSNQVKLLEEELGVKLFLRDKRSVILTPAGEIFVKEFKVLQMQIDHIVSKVKNSDILLSDTLSIGFPDSIDIDSFFIDIFSEFKELYPNIQLKFFRYGIKDLRTQLLNNELDLVFSFSFDINGYNSVEYVEVEKRKAALIMSKNHPLAGKTNLSVSDIQNEPFVCYGPDESYGASILSQTTCQKIGYKPSSFIYAKNSDSIISQVIFNQALTIMDKSICKKNDLIHYDIFSNDYCFEIVGIWKKNIFKPSLEVFIEILKNKEVHHQI